jgi:hypothetical protein
MKNNIIWFENQTSTPEKEYMKKYGYLYDNEEIISDKLKKYNLNAAINDLRDKLQPLHYFLAKARKSFNNNITVYKLNNDVLDKIRNTTIQKMPDETPQLYGKPFIIEAHDLNSNLFGDIDSIIGFYNDYEGTIGETDTIKRFNFLFHTKSNNDQIWHDTIFKLNQSILEKRESNRFMYMSNNFFYLRPFENKGYWDFNMIDYNRNILIEKTYCGDCIYYNSCFTDDNRDLQSKYHICLGGLFDNMLSFIIIFNYMLEAENSPIQTDRKIEHTSYVTNKKRKIIEKKQDWIIKYIYIDKNKVKHEKKEVKSELDKDNLMSKEVRVRGHLRHQAFGVGHKERKWIYIEEYVSTKWVKDGDTKVIVGLQKE